MTSKDDMNTVWDSMVSSKSKKKKDLTREEQIAEGEELDKVMKDAVQGQVELREKLASEQKLNEVASKIKDKGERALLKGEEQKSIGAIEDKPVTVPKPKKFSISAGREAKVREEEDFDLSDAEDEPKIILMLFGDKGDGKTTCMFSPLGKHYTISFDEKTPAIKKAMFNKDTRIKVKDGLRYLNMKDGPTWLKTADISYRYIMQLLDKDAPKFEPDWIGIDGFEILVSDICERRMRFMNDFTVFEAFDWTYWKSRNMYVNNIHLACKRLAKKGVIYTAYVNEKASKIIKGKIMEFKRKPKWAAEVEKKVDIVIELESEQFEDRREFTGTIHSSKHELALTGAKGSVRWNKKKQEGGLNRIMDFKLLI